MVSKHFLMKVIDLFPIAATNLFATERVTKTMVINASCRGNPIGFLYTCRPATNIPRAKIQYREHKTIA